MAGTDRDEAADAVNYTTVWRPQPGPQTDLLTCPASVTEIFFGGARGGGKTDGVLGEWIAHAQRYGENAIGLMIRRELTQLVETIERSRVLYTPLGAKYNASEKMWVFPNGARLRFAYLERDHDADAYQGHSYSRVYVEEAGTFPSERPIMKLQATLRSGTGTPVRVILTGNPGGPGHGWVRMRYVDPAPAGRQVIVDPKTGLRRVYIPSRVKDNKFLGDDYVARLRASGSEQLVKAWLEGDWNAVEGGFFSEWDSAIHVVEPFPVHKDWLRFVSADWGYATPFAIYWWTVVGDDFEHNGRVITRGTMAAFREWYGCSSSNVGIRLTAEEVAKGIREREAGESVRYRVIDPSAFAQTSGPSIAERMAVAGAVFHRADNRRLSEVGSLGGWDAVRGRLKQGKIAFFSSCTHAIRTIPLLQHDQGRPEDLDTEAEDHAADAVRYAVMSRPFVAKVPEPKDERPRYAGDGRFTVNDLIALHEGRGRQRHRV